MTSQERVEDRVDSFRRLVEICRRLMAEDGCPWDREQELETITPYLQEELFELLEAVAARAEGPIAEELGDLFYLLVFASALAVKGGMAITLDGVLDSASEKLIRRHPHVFGDRSVDGTAGAVAQWEEIKQQESSAKTTLGRRPAALPALTTAYRIGEKAGAVRFEWPDARGALAKLREEIDELESVLERDDADAARERQEEIGDILYSVVNLARYYRIDPELALRGTIAKFTRRFHFVEEELRQRGRTPAGSTLEEMDELWNEAKRRGIR